MREAIGRSPDVALTLLLLKLVTDTFRTAGTSGGCVDVSVRHVYMSAQAPDLKDSPVAKAVDLDMVGAGWEPTVEGYLNRVPKARILEAMREAKGEGTAQLLDHLKKGEMATEAERLLKGSGWLPEVLRRADLVAFDDLHAGEGQGDPVDDADDMVAEMPHNGETVDLPAFLMADMPVLDAPMMAVE